MERSAITGVTLTNITEKTGFLGRRIITEEQVCLAASGGSIYLRQHVVEAAGDSWKLFKARLRENAKEYDIPFEDKRN